MRDRVKEDLEPIPELSDDPVWTLADVVGEGRAQQIKAAGALRFHSCGDTGDGKYPLDKNNQLHFGQTSQGVLESQVAVARAMNGDLNPSLPGSTPAFFFHLGDVDYFDNTPSGYHEQFYVPYQEYGGKIIAIPGNHDGEVLLGHQPTTCFEFMKNFCPPHPTVPPAANPIIREMSAQPGVYWWLQTPFLDLVALYSNCAEGPGSLRGAIPGEHQYAWFKDSVLPKIAASRPGGRKALIVAAHHPPITATLFDPTDKGHGSSEEMSQDLDAAFQATGVWPDAIISGHVHNYQRFTRQVTVSAAGEKKNLTYVVAGTGGRPPQSVLKGAGQVKGDVRFEHSHPGNGYILVTATLDQLQIDYHPVPGSDPQNRDQVVIRLQ
jgi:hypothetical protein